MDERFSAQIFSLKYLAAFSCNFNIIKYDYFFSRGG